MRMLAKLFVVASILASAPIARADVSYSVYGVRAGDTLNMREQPSPSATVVQPIPFDADGITLTGRTSQGDWAEVNYQRKRGWVNARYLGIGKQGKFQLPAYLDCSGTEPFWTISLIPGLARAEFLFAQRRSFFNLTRAQTAMNHPNIWLIKGSARPGGDMSLIVRNETCNDGMSDNRYQYSSIALVSGLDMLAGCCRPAIPR